jgi:hypothetical protein
VRGDESGAGGPSGARVQTTKTLHPTVIYVFQTVSLSVEWISTQMLTVLRELAATSSAPTADHTTEVLAMIHGKVYVRAIPPMLIVSSLTLLAACDMRPSAVSVSDAADPPLQDSDTPEVVVTAHRHPPRVPNMGRTASGHRFQRTEGLTPEPSISTAMGALMRTSGATVQKTQALVVGWRRGPAQIRDAAL